VGVSPDGVVVLDKPRGPTSHDMVDVVRRVLRTRRVGHTGTLDPMATGVLPVCVGQATRLAQFLAESEKSYRAEARLGFATSTDDLGGDPLGERCDGQVAIERLREALAELVGPLDQVPPAFSAKRVDGIRAYQRARTGEAVRVPSSRVTVHRLELVRHEADRFEFDVVCSAGTYVRSLARDIGTKLGVGAHLVALRRTESGGFGVEDAISPERLASEGEGALIPLPLLLSEWPAVTVPDSLLSWVANGRVLPLEALAFRGELTDRVRLCDERGAVLGLARRTGAHSIGGPLPRTEGLHPFVVFAPAGQS